MTTAGGVIPRVGDGNRRGFAQDDGAATAGHFGVPVIMVSGDDVFTGHAKKTLGDVETVVTRKSYGIFSGRVITPQRSRKLLAEAVARAVTRIGEFKPFEVEIEGSPLPDEMTVRRLLNHTSGIDFKAQESRDYGGKCYEDLMKGVDAAVETFPFIDSDRLAVAGGSFGGYSTNWILGHTDRFRCAVSHAGLYNLMSFFGATEELFYATWDMGDSPWEDPEIFERWSPHNHQRTMPESKSPAHARRR